MMKEYTTDTSSDRKHDIEKKFDDLLQKAREEYPDIDETLEVMQIVVSHTDKINDYQHLVNLIPYQTSNNSTSI